MKSICSSHTAVNDHILVSDFVHLSPVIPCLQLVNRKVNLLVNLLVSGGSSQPNDKGYCLMH